MINLHGFFNDWSELHIVYLIWLRSWNEITSTERGKNSEQVWGKKVECGCFCNCYRRAGSDKSTNTWKRSQFYHCSTALSQGAQTYSGAHRQYRWAGCGLVCPANKTSLGLPQKTRSQTHVALALSASKPETVVIPKLPARLLVTLFPRRPSPAAHLSDITCCNCCHTAKSTRPMLLCNRYQRPLSPIYTHASRQRGEI